MLLLFMTGVGIVQAGVRAYAATSYAATTGATSGQSVITSTAFSVAPVTGAAGRQSAVTGATGDLDTIVDADNSEA